MAAGLPSACLVATKDYGNSVNRLRFLSRMNCNHLNFGMPRRDFFGRFALGLGGAALAQLAGGRAFAAGAGKSPYVGLPGFPNFAPRAKRVIYLFMSGGPSQMDLFDYKPRLNELNGQELPPSVRAGQRLHDVVEPVVAAAGGEHLQVRAAREVGGVGERVAAAHGEGGG